MLLSNLLTVVRSVLCLAVGVAASQQILACGAGVSQPKFQGKKITLFQDTLFFRTDRIELDIDGSPSAYGVKDQGLENICNGLGPLEPQACRGKNRGSCYAACQSAYRSWNRDLESLGRVMCSIGLGGGSCSVPQVRFQVSPRELFFVSETGVHVKPSNGAVTPQWIRSQPAQLDSLETPYFVIPSGFRRLPYDATPGDVGVVVELPRGEPVPFIVGDTGGALDEGSAKLLARLRGAPALATVKKSNAFGEQVERLEGAKSGDFRVAIFRHTAPFANDAQRRILMLDKSSAELAGFIESIAAERLQAVGGRDGLVACAR